MLRHNPCRVLVLCLLVLLTACANKSNHEFLHQAPAAAEPSRIVTVYVVTTRQLDAKGITLATSDRGQQVSYLRFRISIPALHKTGAIEWSSGRPDPRRSFVTVEQRWLTRAGFEDEISRKRSGIPPAIGVFVHGFNTTFTEAVFRLAQMTADANYDGVPILFAWPSEGNVTGYVADRDAATFSRDQLVDLLTELSGKQTTGQISIVGHSMGAWLSLEAVRQLRISQNDDVVRRLRVILAAPDIDLDVASAQLAVIGPLSPPILTLVSRDDAALRISELLSRNRKRLGRLNVSDPKIQEFARTARIQIVDISGLAASDILKHDAFAALAAYYPKRPSRSFARSAGQVGAFVFSAMGSTLYFPSPTQ